MTYYDFNPLYDNEDDKDKTGSTISGLSTGETGKMGITLFPDRAGFSGSTNNTIHVIINKNLSEKGAAETYSHEANGHGALYILNGYNHRGASHHFRGTKDTNIKLIDMIIKSKKQKQLKKYEVSMNKVRIIFFRLFLLFFSSLWLDKKKTSIFKLLLL
ncbi:MAG: hypothetical protein L6U16_11275 [Porphyromonadaceae bacterium]|nr:MAG: hypothetical protein L6U16_11275 [Porphyromonadaceae bacterium]